jgi:hypothetical protein
MLADAVLMMRLLQSPQKRMLSHWRMFPLSCCITVAAAWKHIAPRSEPKRSAHKEGKQFAARDAKSTPIHLVLQAAL